MKQNIRYILINCALLLFVVGCADLEVENLNHPNQQTVLATPDQYPGVISGAWNSWYYVESGLNAFTLAGMADQFTGSMNNFGMNLYTSEPRVPINNSPTAANNEVVNDGWDNAYAAIGGVNDIMRLVVVGGNKVPDGNGNDITSMITANGYMLQGLSYGYLSLAYDRAFLVDETVEDPGTVEFPEQPNYEEVRDFAVSKFDKAIEIANSTSFTTDPGFLNGTSFTSEEFSQLANSYAARFIALNARNSAENAETDWAAVENYARNGIDSDFVIVGNGFSTPWVHQYSIYATLIGWGRVDQRIVNLLDSSQPKGYPLDGTTDLGPVSTDDQRATTDFEYLSSQWANPERGYEHFSNYRYKRLDPNGSSFQGPHPFMRKAENDLLLAEAIIMQDGPNAEAAGLINNSRVGRGGLEALSGNESKEEMLSALFYERDIELMLSGAGISFADARRRDILKPGTANQLPVPGKELELLALPIYSYPQ